LAGLYGAKSEDRKKHVDFLADFALKHSDDSLPLTMVGTWLVLDGQTERAELFLNRPSERTPKPSTLVVAPEVAAHLVAAELAR
jgi:hypothetical protein